MELVKVPTKELDKVWGLIEKDIKQSLLFSGQLSDSEFVLDTAKEGKFQIWILWDKEQKTNVEKYFGVVITEIIEKKLGKVCHIFMMTGRQRHKWQYLIKDIEKFAKEEKCLMLELITRPGWQKILSQYGYKRTHIVLEKQIKQEKK
tara:strand:+ start:149 stop:589 length:441 start_codon:yes stop_codon:yes gene_type:complete